MKRLKVTKNNFIFWLLGVVILTIAILFSLIYHKINTNYEVIYDGGHFKIITCDDATYIINQDIDGGIKKYERKESSGDTKRKD